MSTFWLAVIAAGFLAVGVYQVASAAGAAAPAAEGAHGSHFTLFEPLLNTEKYGLGEQISLVVVLIVAVAGVV